MQNVKMDNSSKAGNRTVSLRYICTIQRYVDEGLIITLLIITINVIIKNY